MSLPDLESLRCFHAAAQHLNFRLAAKSVGLSPTAFSERIKRLEEDLGGRLFERTTRKVWLTDAGTRLLSAATKCLDAARECEEAVLAEGTRAPFDVRLGTRFELGMSFLVPKLQALREKLPERTIHLIFGDGPDLLDRVVKGDIDAVVTSSRITSTKFRYALLHEEKYVFCAAAGLLTKARPLNAPDDAKNHVLLDSQPNLPLFRYFMDGTGRDEVWSFKRHEILGTIAAVRYRLLEGAGVAVMPEYFMGPDIAAGRVEILKPEVDIRSDWFRLVWRSGNPQEPALFELAEELRTFPLR